MDSPSPSSSSSLPFAKAMELMEGEQEEIEDALEDLLIFPSAEVLRRVAQRLEVHFATEDTIMKTHSFRSEDYESLFQDQKYIMKLAAGPSSKSKKPSSTDCA